MDIERYFNTYHCISVDKLHLGIHLSLDIILYTPIPTPPIGQDSRFEFEDACMSPMHAHGDQCACPSFSITEPLRREPWEYAYCCYYSASYPEDTVALWNLNEDQAQTEPLSKLGRTELHGSILLRIDPRSFHVEF